MKDKIYVFCPECGKRLQAIIKVSAKGFVNAVPTHYVDTSYTRAIRREDCVNEKKHYCPGSYKEGVLR